jgi:hypothetical protein
MPPNNCDPAVTAIESALGDHLCPKCGVEMEPIDIGVEGLPLPNLHSAWLAIW